jgi:glycosyltransferase involved in cell wall biosynthesis
MVNGMARSGVSVVMMAFNEVGNLGTVFREIAAVLDELDRPYEILIIDDGSSDGTGPMADRLTRESAKLRVVHHGVNQGLGGVYRSGFVQAQRELLTFLPADGQIPAAVIKQFVPLMDNADMVLGYLPNRTSSLFARILSKAERALYHLLFGPLPRFQGVLMFRRSLLDHIELKSSGRGWAVVMELIIRASRSGCKLVSVPTEMRPRASGRSKVNNLPTLWANLQQVFVLRRYL